MVSKSQISLLLVGCLLCRAFADSNPLAPVLNSVGNAVDSTLNDTNSAVDTTTGAVGSATNSTASGLQNATAAVGGAVDSTAKALNSTVNTTVAAASSLENTAANIGSTIINETALVAAVGGPITSLIEGIIEDGVRHPLIFWPAFGTSVLKAEVSQQDSLPDCPASGTFYASFGNYPELDGFSEDCAYNLLSFQYGNASDATTASSLPGVNTTIENFGLQQCASIPYEPFYLFMEAVGYTPGKDFYVACYDWRTNPYVDVVTNGPHLELAKNLVEEAYNENQLPVYLLGHSNGPIYALALLASQSQAWRDKYIAGFIAYAGNWAGQGVTYSQLFTGQSLFDGADLPSVAPALETWPYTYMASSAPAIYEDEEVVIQTLDSAGDGGARNFTPADAQELFRAANLSLAAQLFPQFAGNITPDNTVPSTHFYGFFGSGIQTLVGVTLPALSPQNGTANGNFYLDGDGNQEYIDNLSVEVWNSTNGCYHFELNEEKGTSHLELPFSPSVLQRTVNILYSTPPSCNVTASS